MNKDLVKKSISLILLSVMMLPACFSLLPLAVNAEEAPSEASQKSGEDREVVSSPSANRLLSVQDAYSLGFEEDDGGYSVRARGEGADARISGKPGFFPDVAFFGDASLVLSGKKDPSAVISIPAGTGIGGCAFFSFAIAIRGEGDQTVSVTLSSAKEVRTFEKTVKAGGWRALFFDISEHQSLSDVRKIEVTVVGENVSFALDLVGLSFSDKALFTMYYIADGYTASEGSELSFSPSSMTLSARGENPYIVASDTEEGLDLSGDRAIRLRFRGGSCHTAELFFTTPTQREFAPDMGVSAQITGDGDISSCVFRVKADLLTGFGIVFRGSFDCDIEILSVSVVSYPSPPPDEGSIDECLLSPGGQEITVRGSLGKDAQKKYEGASLYLYALEPYQPTSFLTLGSTAYAETKASGSSFSFSVPCAGNTSLVYKKFAVGVYYGGSVVPITSAVYISNPDSLSENTEILKTPSGIKGSSVSQGSFPASGENYSLVRVRLERLFSSSPTKNGFTYGGRSFFLSEEYAEKLDETMKRYASLGERVYIVLSVSRSGDESLDRCLIGSDIPYAGENTKYYAFNTESDEGIIFLRAAVDHLASRYGAGGEIPALCGLILGQNVNDAERYFRTKEITSCGLAFSVIRALRIADIAARIRVPSLSVFLGLGCDWSGEGGENAYGSCGSRELLDAVLEISRDEGGLGFGIAFDPFPTDPSYLSYEDENPEKGYEASRITFANLDVLSSYLLSPGMRYEGEDREVILAESTDSSRTAGNAESLTKEYIADYIKASSLPVFGAFIVSHPVSEDNVYSLIDTDRFGEIAEKYLPLPGVATLPDGLEKRKLTEKKIGSEVPKSVSSSALLFDFGKDEAGFRPLYGCTGIEARVSVSERKDILSAGFSSEKEGLPGISVSLPSPLALSAVGAIYFDIRPASLPEGVKSAELLVLLRSGEDAVLFRGELGAGDWSTVFLDLSGGELEAFDRMDIMISSEKSLGEPTLLIGSVKIGSDSASNAELERLVSRMRETREEEGSKKEIDGKTVRLLIFLIVCAGTLEVLNLLLKRGKERDAE